jgi:hypothetical protein
MNTLYQSLDDATVMTKKSWKALYWEFKGEENIEKVTRTLWETIKLEWNLVEYYEG